MFRSLSTIGLALSAIVAGTPAPAMEQIAPLTGEADPARLTAARTLVQTMRSEQQARAAAARSVSTDAESEFSRLVPAPVAMRYQLSDPQGFGRMHEQAVKLITDDRLQMLSETVPLVVDALVRRYARHFTVADLRAMNEFYLSPTGQRLIAEQPSMAVDDREFQQGVLRAVVAAHGATVVPKLAVILAPVIRQATPSTAAGKTP